MEITLLDYQGTYGGPASRDEVVRALKEALALVEGTKKYAEIRCSGFRIDHLPSEEELEA